MPGMCSLDRARRGEEQGEPVYDPVRLCWVSGATAGKRPGVAPLSWRIPSSDALAPRDGGVGFRLWSEADLPLYREMMTDADLWRYMPELAPQALSDEDLLSLILLSREAGHHRVHAILQDDIPIGQVRLEFGPDGQSAELSYWLGRAARGKGLGLTAVRDYLARSLPELPAIRVLVARVHQDNAASARLLAGCGFAPVERTLSGLAPRGRDPGDWPTFRRLVG